MTSFAGLTLAYGQGHVPIALPPGAEPHVIRKRPLPKLSDPRGAVRAALDAPIGAPPLGALARGRRSACILICDVTRPVPNHLFLRPMVEDLTGAGIPLDAITILVATGLHRPNEGEELRELVRDPWVLEHVRIENHFARDDAAHLDLGVTATRGTPVKLDRRFMEDPLALQCNLARNPLHEEQLEIVRMIGDIYALNTVIDEDRDLVAVTFGEIIASHLAAVAAVRPSAVVSMPRRFSTVVTSAAGHPLDKTYYQTVKGMVTPMGILVPGGTLIIASACSEGIGSPEFREAQARLVRLGPDAFLDTLLAKRFADVDEWQTEMQLKPMRLGRIQLHTTGLDDEDRRITGVELVDDLDDAIAAAVARHGDPAVAVIPEGPYVVPVLGCTDA